MGPIQWLEARVPGFVDLSAEERNAIFHFALLWSLFEAKALDTHASARSILALIHEWSANGSLGAEAFQDSLRYFRLRYFQNGQPSHHFQGLHLRDNDSPELVRSVLTSENNNPADSVAVLLIVIYRLRNNLFHGVKWAYGIHDQLENFTWANTALMLALDRTQ